MKESKSLNLCCSGLPGSLLPWLWELNLPPEEVGFTINYVQIQWFSPGYKSTRDRCGAVPLGTVLSFASRLVRSTHHTSVKEEEPGCALVIHSAWQSLLTKSLQCSPGWCGWVDWEPACELKGHWFHRSRIAGQAPSWWRGRGNQPTDVSLTHPKFPSLSFSLPSFLSKNK